MQVTEVEWRKWEINKKKSEREGSCVGNRKTRIKRNDTVGRQRRRQTQAADISRMQ